MLGTGDTSKMPLGVPCLLEAQTLKNCKCKWDVEEGAEGLHLVRDAGKLPKDKAHGQSLRG